MREILAGLIIFITIIAVIEPRWVGEFAAEVMKGYYCAGVGMYCDD